MSTQERLRMWFSESYVFRRDDCRETIFKSTLFENVDDLVTTRTGCNRQRVAAGRRFDGVGSSSKQYGFLCDGLEIIDAFATDQGIELRRFERYAVFPKQSFEAIPIVQRKVLVQVFLIRKRQSFLICNLSESFHVDRIVIGKDSVEIEDQSANHAMP